MCSCLVCRIFVQSGYCGILIEQSLMMNRRRMEKTDIAMADDTRNNDNQSTYDSRDTAASVDTKLKKDINVVIYSCATMWHETETEMLQLLKSIMRLKIYKTFCCCCIHSLIICLFRLDIDQSARRKAQEYFGIKDPDYYEYEGHIFFDDAMDENENGEMEPNKFVQILVSVIDQAAT